MSRKSIGSIFRAAVVAMGLAGAGPASAVVYIGVFDPPVFMGSATIDIPASCIMPAGWVSVASCGGGDTGDFLNVVVTNQPAPPVTGTLTFAPPVVVGGITGLWWVGGVLTGIDSILLGPEPPNGSFSNPGGYALRFISGHAPEATGDPRVLLFACGVISDFTTSGISVPSICPSPSQVGDPAMQEPFQQVPEPGPLALLLAALGAAGWFLWRRRVRRIS